MQNTFIRNIQVGLVKYSKGLCNRPPGWQNAKPFENLPGPKPTFLLGNTWRLFPIIGDLHNIQPHVMHNKFYKKYGDIMCLKGIYGKKPIVILFEPAAIEKVFRCEGPVPERQLLRCFTYYKRFIRKDIFGDIGGLVSANGKKWLELRKLVNPMFMQPKIANQYIPKIDLVAADFLKNVRGLSQSNPNGEMPDDFQNELNKFAFESVGLIALDKRFGALSPNGDNNAQNVVNNVIKFFSVTYKIESMPFPLALRRLTPTWKTFVNVADDIVLTLKEHIDEESQKIKNRQSNNLDDESSIFQKLTKIDSRIALVMTIDLLLAGIDSTARMVASIMYYIAKNQDKQNKLRKELLSLLPTKTSPVTAHVLVEAHYLKAVVREGTRIASLSVDNVRTTVTDLVLCGYQIPKGTEIHTSHLCISTQTNKYFPKANEFIPERWLRDLDGEMSYKKVHPFVTMPFGFGLRSCVGKRFAVLEIQILLAKVIRNFVLEWPHEDMVFKSDLMHSCAKPLRLRIKELES